VVRGDLLVVAALEEETAAFPTDVEVLHLGVGKVQAAAALAAALGASTQPPGLVLNVGTAGGLHGQPLGTVVEIGTVLQHDFDVAGVSAFVGRPVRGGPIDLDAPPDANTTLATGDRLVLDSDERDRLADTAQLVDMEGYAIAAVCRAVGVPVRMLKAVSDGADEGAVLDWPAALARCSAALCEAAQRRGLLPG
jgi:adenosylhomocysteine nucleosidase